MDFCKGKMIIRGEKGDETLWFFRKDGKRTDEKKLNY